MINVSKLWQIKLLNNILLDFDFSFGATQIVGELSLALSGFGDAPNDNDVLRFGFGLIVGAHCSYDLSLWLV